MHLVLFLFLGLIVGAVARFLVPGKESGGWVLSTLLGIAGSFAGAFLGRTLGLYREGEPVGFLVSVIGAIILLVLYHAVVGRRMSA